MQNEYDDKMASTIIHSTRNPLMLMGGVVRSIKKKLDKNIELGVEAKEFLDMLGTETTQLEGILGELIDYTQKAESLRIVRIIEFEPQHYQAGLSIITYFSKILSQKYPNSDVKVKIEQSGNEVKLTIETPDGEKEEITKTLDQYGQVLRGEIPPEGLNLSPFEVMSLKNKLELAALELRQAEQLHRICEHKNNERINALEYNVRQLQNIIANGITSTISSVNVLSDVINKYSYDTKLKYDIQVLLDKINNGISLSDEQEVKRILANIRSSEPDLLTELKDFALNSLAGVSGNFLYAWIVAILPKC